MGQELSTEGSTEYSIETPNGKFKGLTIRDPNTGEALCHRFSGIRYALPILKRWTKSRPVPDDYDYSSAEYKTFPPGCPQPLISGKLDFQNPEVPGEEDCAYLNIWVPASADLSKANLPVFFYIHGGWLQYGNACQNAMMDPRTLLSQFDNNFIIVSPAYRLNVLGFIGTKHTAAEGHNFGFWDQRLALEWTSRFIKYFGGDATKITVGGLSAGSYSVFFQLAFEVYHPDAPQLIKQAVFFSNSVIAQPKLLEETETQFEEYLRVLNIDAKLSGPEKIEALRKLDVQVLEDAIIKTKMHTFRAVTDDSFISTTLLEDLYSGEYGLKLQEKGIRILIGEVDNEPVMYSYLNTPISKEELPIQLENYYPKKIIPTLLELYDKSTSTEELRLDFGNALGDSQVYASSRGFLNNIVKKTSDLESKIFRYRMSYAPGYIRKQLDDEGIEGIIHSNDQVVWFFSSAEVLSEEEKTIIRTFLVPYVDFINLKEVNWGTKNIKQYQYLSKEGNISIKDDEFWDKYLEIAEKLYLAQIK